MAGSPFNAEEMMKLFGSMKLPSAEQLQALADAQKRNLEAMVAANRLAMEGAQALARRNLDILQQAMAELAQTMQNLASLEGNPAQKAQQQAEAMKAAYERAVANMKELADLIQKSNGEAMEVLNRRFSEAMEELRGLMGQGR
ncbi:phasin family protein [Rubritepida flocculans]|uniref:phasin family protein n=1 Tax=Rubritepida flocculans TaxID=182403 RepID=UPI00040EBB12|nr:TIGR01841 family phasin [Rubritepida flocculans]